MLKKMVTRMRKPPSGECSADKASAASYDVYFSSAIPKSPPHVFSDGRRYLTRGKELNHGGNHVDCIAASSASIKLAPNLAEA